MNTKNLKTLIEVLKRAKERDDNFDIHYWQATNHSLITSEEELHNCGSAACVGGWLAVSPEWKEAGGKVGELGEPLFLHCNDPSMSVAFWLDTDEKMARKILGTSRKYRKSLKKFYGKSNPKLKHVIKRLEKLYAFYTQTY